MECNKSSIPHTRGGLRARAIRRCGELLKQIEPDKGGRPLKTYDATDIGLSRSQAARDAGKNNQYEQMKHDGTDTLTRTAYILSANVHRRHLTKGQQAMAVAMAYPETQQGKKRTSSINEEVSKVSSGNLSMARYVLRETFKPEGQKYPDRCLAVMAGTLALNEAYALTQADVKKREEEERIRQENLAKLGAPDPRQLFSIHGLAFLPSWFPWPVGGT